MKFYAHLVEIESLTVKLDDLKLDEAQKKHLAGLADSMIQHEILDLILSKLTTSEKAVFLSKFHQDPHDKKLLEFVSKRVDNIEEEIKEAVEKVKNELHKDIENAKREGK